MKTTVEVYRDRKKEWRWRMLRKGRIVADSAEGYRSHHHCRRSLTAILKSGFVFKLWNTGKSIASRTSSRT